MMLTIRSVLLRTAKIVNDDRSILLRITLLMNGSTVAVCCKLLQTTAKIVNVDESMLLRRMIIESVLRCGDVAANRVVDE